MEKRSSGCRIAAGRQTGRVTIASLLQRVRQARTVQVVPNLPRLAVALLEMAEPRRLHQEVVRRHAREHVARARPLLHLVLLQAERSRVPHGRRGREAP